MSLEIDIRTAYDRMVQIVLAAPTVSTGMAALLAYCTEVFPGAVWDSLRDLDVHADVAALRGWLEMLLTEEPPASTVKTFRFGLYEAEDEDGPTSILYLSGSVKDYTPDSLDWACWTEETYLPEARYADSSILKSLLHTVQSEPEAVLLAEYVLCLGYACLAVCALLRSLPTSLVLGEAEQRVVVVGFDDGDNVLLGQMERQGWIPALIPQTTSSVFRFEEE